MDATVKSGGAPVDAINDLRNTLDWLRAQGDLIETDKPVDPDLEITGLQKHLDGAAAPSCLRTSRASQTTAS